MLQFRPRRFAYICSTWVHHCPRSTPAVRAFYFPIRDQPHALAVLQQSQAGILDQNFIHRPACIFLIQTPDLRLLNFRSPGYFLFVDFYKILIGVSLGVAPGILMLSILASLWRGRNSSDEFSRVE